MESTVSLPLHSSTLSRLVAHLRQDNGGPQDLADAISHAVNSWISAREAKIPAPVVQLPPAPAPRNVPPGPGWNLPERRKFRFRIEDVAFE